jgi:UDP-2,3-diacylglucosamine pyrophosphatase LpxH
MKKSILYTLAALAILLAFGFIAWAFSQHGTYGLFHVENIFRYAFIGLGVSGVILLGLLLLHIVITRGKPAGSWRRLSVPVLVLTVLEIIVPVFAFVYLSGMTSPGVGDTSPQLTVTDTPGTYDVPDLGIVDYSGQPVSYTLSWGKTGSESIAVVNEEKSSRQHIFMLRNLEPGTEYWYRLNDTEKCFFRTPDLSKQSLHFAVGSDAHFGAGTNRPDLTTQMLDQISSPANGYSYFYFLGDLVENGFQGGNWKAALQAFSATTSTIPSVLIAGNHDTLFAGLNYFKKYCYPAGLDSQSGSRLWHRIDVGNIHFLVVDIEWSAESYTKQQAAWLEEQLKSIPADDWKIVMSHGFYYCSGSVAGGWHWYDNPETIGALTPLFEKYSVDLVFSGHEHQLELLQKSGVTYVICGGFGGALDPIRTYISPASLWYAGETYGFADVTINESEARIFFRDPSGAVLESFTISK